MAEMWLRDYGFEMTAEMGQAMLDDQKTTVRVRDSQNMAAVKEALRSEGLNIEEGCMLRKPFIYRDMDYLVSWSFCRRTYNCPG